MENMENMENFESTESNENVEFSNEIISSSKTIFDDVYTELSKCTKNKYNKFGFKGLITFIKVVYIVDGDTCDVVFPVNLEGHINFIKTRVRMYGYDAPESITRDLEQKKRGIEAKNALKELIYNNNSYNNSYNESYDNSIPLIMRVVGTDAFGRSLAMIYRLENLEIHNYLKEELLNYSCNSIDQMWIKTDYQNKNDINKNSMIVKFNKMSEFIDNNFNCFTCINDKMIELGHVKHK